MNWKILDSNEQFKSLLDSSSIGFCAIFKHSTRCNISSMSKDRIERSWNILPENFELYFLDLLTYRPLSNAIEELLMVEHQSPQLLLLHNGKCVYQASHSAINVQVLAEQIKLFQN